MEHSKASLLSIINIFTIITVIQINQSNAMEIITGIQQDLSCTGNDSCTINCGDCSGGITLTCPLDISYSCTVNCTGIDSCNKVQIDWGQDGTGDLICNGEASCTEVDFPVPPPDTALTTTCDSIAECDTAQIFCPTNAQCDIICSTTDSCIDAQITWPDTDGLGSIVCDGPSSCEGVNFPIPSPNDPLTVICDSDSECKKSEITCPTSGVCEIQCIDVDSCRGLTINWPDTAGLGTLICDGDGACRGVDFPIPDPNTPLTIHCDVVGECEQAVINCPTNADCTVICSVDSACIDAVINWGSGLNTLTCTDVDSCAGINFPVPDSNTDLTITCNYDAQCSGATLYCPSNADCTVECLAQDACLNTVIVWPTDSTATGTLECDGQSSCSNTNFPVPAPNTDLDIFCDSAEECYGSTINCPANANCNVYCSATDSCWLADINWGTGTNTLECTGGQGSCAYVQFPDTTQTPIICDQQLECSGANIVCPANTDCTVTCDGRASCLGSTIECPSSANCIVECDGDTACMGTTVNWGSGDNTLNCTGVGPETCRDVVFPVPDPTIPLTITCESDSECYGSTIYCPLLADCTVECLEQDACNSATIIWPTRADVTSSLICSNDTDSCLDTTTPPIYIPVTNTGDYYLNCNTTYQCRGFVIDCPANWGCFITCDALGACKDMLINWVESQSHSILCNTYDEVCWGVHVSNSDQTTDLILDCSADSMCRGMTVDCPDSAACNISCSGINSCNAMVPNWDTSQVYSIACSPQEAACKNIGNIASSDQTTDLFLDCGGFETCAGSTIHCPSSANCDIQCNAGSGYSCQGTTIYGPTGFDLDIDCRNNYACDSSTWFAADVSQLTVTDCAQGQWTCSQLSVYFPPNDAGNKLAVFDRPDDSLGFNLNFYAINGWLDVDIINDNTNNFAGSASTFHCGALYGLSCTMSTTEWFTGCGACDQPGLTPTTVAPVTRSPTAPTTHSPTTQPITTKSPTTQGGTDNASNIQMITSWIIVATSLVFIIV